MNIVTDIILPLALAFIMFVLGLGLTFDDFAMIVSCMLQASGRNCRLLCDTADNICSVTQQTMSAV